MLNLPTDKPRPAEGCRRSVMVYRRLDERAWESVQRLALAEGCEAETVLLAAWLCLLSRWSGETNVFVGLPTRVLTQQDPGDRIDACFDTITLLGNLSDDPSFRAFLRIRCTNPIFPAA